MFSYKFTGDTPKRFKGAIIKPGDAVDSDEELINGELEPTNAAAKAAAKATEAADAARAERHAKERLAAAQGLSVEEAFPELAPDPAAGVSAGKSKSAAAAPAAPQEA
jgi:hypothetical protein